MLNRLFRPHDKIQIQPIINPSCYDLVMYGRTTGCPFISVAKRVLDKWNIAYREIMIDEDPEARERVRLWTGFLSVPTLIITEKDAILPYQEVMPLEKGKSPRGINRGAMITEPSSDELEVWLRIYGFIQ